jgi:hypothetical protein
VTRFKLVPPAPDSLDAVAAAQRAVPLVPDSEDDCCARLMRRCDLPSRDVARTWLTFLRALELVEETPGGFRRLRTDPTPDHLRAAFRRRVFGAAELLDALEAAGEPLDGDELFERFREQVPTWEHHKEPTRWVDLWRERVETLCAWLVRLDLAESTPDGYRA